MQNYFTQKQYIIRKKKQQQQKQKQKQKQKQSHSLTFYYMASKVCRVSVMLNNELFKVYSYHTD